MDLMAQVARLDHDQVYWGMGESVALDQLKSGDRVFGAADLVEAIAELKLEDVFYIDKNCDLPAGQYRLIPPDEENKSWHFDPLPQEQRKTVPGVPTLEQAFYAFLTAGTEAPRVAAWAKWFANTMDGRIK